MYYDICGLSLEELLSRHNDLVYKIANHLFSRLPSSVQMDDLIQAGMIGLIEASKNYDATKGASFETYATIRLRGAMIDDIRKGDWIPRSVHKNIRTITEAIKVVENREGRTAKDTEIAKELKVSLTDYQAMLQDSLRAKITGYDDLGFGEHRVQQNPNVGVSDPSHSFEKQKFKEFLIHQLVKLPEKERVILSLYYQEELNLREIGEIMGVSESRICQIHSQALCRLKSRMKNMEF
jgi:RNA polymerase sigma factor for flagellar operon FliA